jgi:hypothetical protein
MTVNGHMSSPESNYGNPMWERDSNCFQQMDTTPSTSAKQRLPQVPSSKLATPIETVPPSNSLHQDLWTTLTVIDRKLNERIMQVASIAANLPLPPGDQIGPETVYANESWIRETLRQLEVTPIRGDTLNAYLLESMIKSCRSALEIIKGLHGKLGVAGPTADDIIIDTSELTC